MCTASRNGFIKKTPLEAYSRPKRGGIIGAGLPTAVGAALSARLSGSDSVAVAFFGGLPRTLFPELRTAFDAFAAGVLPRLKEKGINLNVYYVSSAELFDRLSEEERNEIFPYSVASSAMMFSGFTSR